jgi:hypothetical protein
MLLRDLNIEQQDPVTMTALGRVWGYTVGYALTYPLSIIHASLCLRPDTSPLVGLVPWSPLGRQHWAALPAKIIERLLNALCTYVLSLLSHTLDRQQPTTHHQ